MKYYLPVTTRPSSRVARGISWLVALCHALEIPRRKLHGMTGEQLHLSLICFMLFQSAYALDASSYWQCTVRDQTLKQWQAQNKYQRLANTNAFDLCKKNSENPRSCKLVDGECESFTRALSNRKMWQCTALDQAAHVWHQTSSTREAAAIGAKATCQAQSTQPESCYVNLIGCHNLNKRN